MSDLIQSTVVLVLAIALAVLWNQVSHKPWGPDAPAKNHPTLNACERRHAMS